MAKTMTPSTKRKAITNGQIDKAVDAYRAMLRKHRKELASEAAQHVLCSDEYVNEQVGVLRHRIEAVSDLISRSVKVNRSRSPEETLKATGRRQYTDASVVARMPRGEGEDATVYFFKLGRYVNDADLQKEYELRGLIPDPYAQSAVNEADPAFADEYPNGTHWKDAVGEWCFAVFYQWRDDGRNVSVSRRDNGWDDIWWFSGVRK